MYFIAFAVVVTVVLNLLYYAVRKKRHKRIKQKIIDAPRSERVGYEVIQPTISIREVLVLGIIIIFIVPNLISLASTSWLWGILIAFIGLLVGAIAWQIGVKQKRKRMILYETYLQIRNGNGTETSLYFNQIRKLHFFQCYTGQYKEANPSVSIYGVNGYVYLDSLPLTVPQYTTLRRYCAKHQIAVRDEFAKTITLHDTMFSDTKKDE